MRRKIMLSVLLVFLIGLLAIAFTGCELNTDVVTSYKIEDDHAVLLKFKGTSEMKEFTVLDEYEGKPVTKIDKFALANAQYLEKIHIGKNVNEIDIWALSNSLELKEFAIDESNTTFAVKDGVLYTKDMATLIAYPNKNKFTPFTEIPDPKDAKKTIIKFDFTMPESVITVRSNAFYKCSALYKITLSPILESIEDRAFLKCYNVESMPFPDSLKRIAADGCSYMGELTDCFIPKSVEYLGNHSLFGINKKDAVKAIRFERSSLDGIEFGGKQWRPYDHTGFKRLPLVFDQTRGGN